jgi:hypothetical protein
VRENSSLFNSYYISYILRNTNPDFNHEIVWYKKYKLYGIRSFITDSYKWPTWRTIPLSICLFQFSTCFEQPRTHHQEHQLNQYNIWYVSLCVGDRLVCRSGRNFPTCILDGLSDTYQMLYWYNWFSWWWAQGYSKHVENWNKHIEKNNCASSWSFIRIIPRWQHGQQNIKFYYHVCKISVLLPIQSPKIL